MSLTIYDTPVLKQIIKFMSSAFLKIMGWEIDPNIPVVKKFIAPVYPHTSNWDLLFGLAYTFKSGVRLHWMAKSSLFWGPLGPILRWFGGIPINRSKANAVVKDTIKAFEESEQLVIVIPPEGTRGYRDHLKSGFYHMALGAKVPVYMSYIDFKAKRVGIGELLVITGDSDVDLAVMREFYKDMEGLNPENACRIEFKKPIKVTLDPQN